jgi:hypothetical protein
MAFFLWEEGFNRADIRGSNKEQQIPPLRYAPVGMTILFGCWKLVGQFGRTEGRTVDPSTTLGSD